jgi:bifunctional UDP-N-acetylglucosamine pyrophosphorylase/glucosamine-1-phosphate N-acetyltransferase
MRAPLAKALHPIGGRPMIRHLIATLEAADVARVVVVVGDGMDAVADAVAPHETVVQTERLGTAHAALQARSALDGFDGDILILNGDNPLIPEDAVRALCVARADAADPAVVVLGFRPNDAAAYGRILTDDTGAVTRIVEAKDADADERAVGFCNSGMMAVDGTICFDLLADVGNDNAKGEYYLPDIVALAHGRGRAVHAVEGDARDLIGVNSQSERAAAETHFQDRMRTQAMDGGAVLIAPETVFFAWDTVIAPGAVIEPHVVFGPGVRVGDGAVVRSFCHLENTAVGSGVSVGPFARLRGGTVLETGAYIGNFVEAKNAVFEAGAKASHLSYLGDSRIGAKANIGAGTITCNYDGFKKSRTDIGPGAFIGSNTALVAPVSIGAGAIVGAGSTVTRDVPDDALTVVRGETRTVDGGARRYRDTKRSKD